MVVLRGRNGNPGCAWFLFFWGGILALALAAIEIFSPISLVEKFQEKWALVGQKTAQRVHHKERAEHWR